MVRRLLLCLLIVEYALHIPAAKTRHYASVSSGCDRNHSLRTPLYRSSSRNPSFPLAEGILHCIWENLFRSFQHDQPLHSCLIGFCSLRFAYIISNLNTSPPHLSELVDTVHRPSAFSWSYGERYSCRTPFDSMVSLTCAHHVLHLCKRRDSSMNAIFEIF